MVKGDFLQEMGLGPILIDWGRSILAKRKRKFSS